MVEEPWWWSTSAHQPYSETFQVKAVDTGSCEKT